MSFNYLKKMPTPEEIKEQLPVSEKIQEIKKQRDKEIADIITGKDDRFLCIIGPCSADNEDAVCEYINKLSRVAEDIKDKVLVVPRIYTNKPRTTGSGYKGIASQIIQTIIYSHFYSFALIIIFNFIYYIFNIIFLTN